MTGRRSVDCLDKEYDAKYLHELEWETRQIIQFVESLGRKGKLGMAGPMSCSKERELQK